MKFSFFSHLAQHKGAKILITAFELMIYPWIFVLVFYLLTLLSLAILNLAFGQGSMPEPIAGIFAILGVIFAFLWLAVMIIAYLSTLIGGILIYVGTGIYASNKGYSPVLFVLLSIFCIGLIAPLILAFLPDKEVA